MSVEFPIVDRLIDGLRDYAAIYDAQEELILNAFREAAEAVRADEREACAKIAQDNWDGSGLETASRIRARGEKEEAK